MSSSFFFDPIFRPSWALFDFDFWPRSRLFDPSATTSRRYYRRASYEEFPPSASLPPLSTSFNFEPSLDFDSFVSRANRASSGLFESDNQRVSNSNKHRVSVDVSGFNPKSIKAEIKDSNTLIVTGQEGNRHESEDYVLKELRKTYKLPEGLDLDRVASFVTSNGSLFVVEIPFKEVAENSNTNLSKARSASYDTLSSSNREEQRFSSSTVGGAVGNASSSSASSSSASSSSSAQRRFEVSLSVPENIDPSQINVSCKNNELFIRIENKIEKPHHRSSYFYSKQQTLPNDIDIDSLKCEYVNNQLTVTASILNSNDRSKEIPIPVQVAAAANRTQSFAETKA